MKFVVTEQGKGDLLIQVIASAGLNIYWKYVKVNKKKTHCYLIMIRENITITLYNTIDWSQHKTKTRKMYILNNSTSYHFIINNCTTL
jgi:hypothetical protein